jgi:BirA family biotin operon repressor/biotin-[acetyl-CoA-carboxylase] ligase
VIGSPRVHHRLTDSTNQRAKELADAGAPHGTLVTADEQTAGRGRQGRAWVAPPGTAILMSLVIRDLDESAAMLPLAAAVAVAEACESAAGVQAAIKWPNDVWIDRRKVCGILVEGRPAAGWAVVGIGLNVTTTEFPDEIREIATSLAVASGTLSVDDTLATLLEALDRRLLDPPEAVLAAWRERDAIKGERIAWADGSGVAAGIDDSGSLLVETDDGRIALGSGQVHLRLSS